MANQQTNQTANQQLKDQLDSYRSRVSKSRKRKRIAYIAGLCLVAVAIVALVLPAATLEYGKTYCGQEEHTHTDACVNRTVICTLPDTSNGNGHVHVPSCYDEQGALACGKTAVAHMHLANCVNEEQTALVCGQEETVHMHTLACVDSNTNTFVCDYEGKAHVHGVTCYSLGADGAYVLMCQEPSVGHVHTLLCLDPNTGEVACGLEEAIEIEHVHTDACYEEELICGMEEHVHNELCYDEITEAIMKKDEESSAAKEAAEEAAGVEPGVAEGDLTEEEIAEAKDQGLLFENDDVIVTFSVPDKYMDDIQLTVTETDEEVEYVEAVDATEEVNAEGEPVDDEAAQDGDNGEPMFFSEEGEEAEGDGADEGTDEVDEPTDAIDSVNETLVAEPEDEPAYKINLRIEATLDGEPVEDISKLGMTAKLQMKQRVIAPILAGIDTTDVAPEVKGEVGAEITVLQQPDNSQVASLSEIRSKQVDQIVVTNVQQAATTVNVVARVLTATANDTPNPSFTVMYYAPVPVPVLGASGDLTVIDTAIRDSKNNLVSKGEGNSNMPTNTAAPSTKSLTLDNGTVKTSNQLVKIYSSMDCMYYAQPSLQYFNKIYENGNYELTDIEVNGKNYPFTDKIHFTNRKDSEGTYEDETYILIEEGTVIKLIYGLTENRNYRVGASFYDYDITDGSIYTSAANADAQKNAKATSKQTNDTPWYANTKAKGINDPGNHDETSNGAQLAFGNKNAGTGMHAQVWTDAAKRANNLNMTNSGAYGGCTFGLVTGLDGDKIVYASGVDAPNLFNDGTAIGKTTYEDAQNTEAKDSKNNLTFVRIGDTYTLSQATVGNGKKTNTIENLDKFNHPKASNKIWTNNFWPMDNSSSHGTKDHDLTFGSTSYTANRKYGSGKWDTFPTSDDTTDHNSYFGMHYTVDFSLTEDYVGPLEYLFFGDDDLWIFLDGKLVVDIGGVHSSVGEYVNLWDHIKKGTAGKHTLSVFYTERGASGSTCYMNFTLPSVSSVIKEQDTGTVTITKEVSAAEGSQHFDRDFNFEMTLTGADNKKLRDDYSYTRYKADGKTESNLIIWDGGTFRLKSGERIVVKYLPIGAKFTIKEVLSEDDPYYSSYKYYEGTSVPTHSYTSEELGKSLLFEEGVVESGGTEYRLEYTNTVPYELPATGGEGTHWYWVGGGVLVALALLMLWRRQMMATVPASSFTKTEASVLAFFGDTQNASPSGKPESVYSKGWSRAGKGDGSTRKGGRY